GLLRQGRRKGKAAQGSFDGSRLQAGNRGGSALFDRKIGFGFAGKHLGPWTEAIWGRSAALSAAMVSYIGRRRMATWRSGDAADCKSAYPGSIPGVASIGLQPAPFL